MDRTEIFQNVKTAAYQIIEGKGATNYAIGLATAKIIEALLHDEGRVLPVSSWQEEYGVCLWLTSIVNWRGVDAVLTVPMNENDRADRLHDECGRHQLEVQSLADTEESDGQREHQRKQRAHNEQQAQHTCHQQGPPPEGDDGDGQHESADRVQHKQQAEYTADAVEDEVEVDPAHREEQEGAQPLPDNR